MKYKVGFGFDVHRLEEGLPLALGGIVVPSEKGALGHSDADVIIHAICDALLGAAGLRDIGYHFPDTDPSLKQIDSKIILGSVKELVAGKRYSISNIDITVCLEKPKISAFIEAMRDTLSRVLDIPAEDISIKATTAEKLGFTGREEGIAAYAVALIIRE